MEGVAAATEGRGRAREEGEGGGEEKGARDRGKPEVSRVAEDRARPVGIKRGPTDLTWSPPRLQWGVKSRDVSSGDRAPREWTNWVRQQHAIH